MKNFIIIILMIFFTSCTVNIPDIKITGEKTALENQVMGDYTRIKEEAWMIASERGDGQLKVTADRKDVVEAVRDREFYRDDVKEYKIKGLLGENRKGLLELVDPAGLSELKEQDQRIVLSTLENENKAREIIMKRIIETDTRYRSAPEEVYGSFFIMNLEASPEDTYFRNTKGGWDRK